MASTLLGEVFTWGDASTWTWSKWKRALRMLCVSKQLTMNVAASIWEVAHIAIMQAYPNERREWLRALTATSLKQQQPSSSSWLGHVLYRLNVERARMDDMPLRVCSEHGFCVAQFLAPATGYCKYQTDETDVRKSRKAARMLLGAVAAREEHARMYHAPAWASSWAVFVCPPAQRKVPFALFMVYADEWGRLTGDQLAWAGQLLCETVQRAVLEMQTVALDALQPQCVGLDSEYDADAACALWALCYAAAVAVQYKRDGDVQDMMDYAVRLARAWLCVRAAHLHTRVQDADVAAVCLLARRECLFTEGECGRMVPHVRAVVCGTMEPHATLRSAVACAVANAFPICKLPAVQQLLADKDLWHVMAHCACVRDTHNLNVYNARWLRVFLQGYVPWAVCVELLAAVRSSIGSGDCNSELWHVVQSILTVVEIEGPVNWPSTQALHSPGSVLCELLDAVMRLDGPVGTALVPIVCAPRVVRAVVFASMFTRLQLKTALFGWGRERSHELPGCVTVLLLAAVERVCVCTCTAGGAGTGTTTCAEHADTVAAWARWLAVQCVACCGVAAGFDTHGAWEEGAYALRMLFAMACPLGARTARGAFRQVLVGASSTPASQWHGDDTCDDVLLDLIADAPLLSADASGSSSESSSRVTMLHRLVHSGDKAQELAIALWGTARGLPVSDPVMDAVVLYHALLLQTSLLAQCDAGAPHRHRLSHVRTRSIHRSHAVTIHGAVNVLAALPSLRCGAAVKDAHTQALLRMCVRALDACVTSSEQHAALTALVQRLPFVVCSLAKWQPAVAPVAWSWVAGAMSTVWQRWASVVLWELEAARRNCVDDATYWHTFARGAVQTGYMQTLVRCLYYGTEHYTSQALLERAWTLLDGNNAFVPCSLNLAMAALRCLARRRDDNTWCPGFVLWTLVGRTAEWWLVKYHASIGQDCISLAAKALQWAKDSMMPGRCRCDANLFNMVTGTAMLYRGLAPVIVATKPDSRAGVLVQLCELLHMQHPHCKVWKAVQLGVNSEHVLIILLHAVHDLLAAASLESVPVRVLRGVVQCVQECFEDAVGNTTSSLLLNNASRVLVLVCKACARLTSAVASSTIPWHVLLELQKQLTLCARGYVEFPRSAAVMPAIERHMWGAFQLLDVLLMGKGVGNDKREFVYVTVCMCAQWLQDEALRALPFSVARGIAVCLHGVVAKAACRRALFAHSALCQTLFQALQACCYADNSDKDVVLVQCCQLLAVALRQRARTWQQRHGLRAAVLDACYKASHAAVTFLRELLCLAATTAVGVYVVDAATTCVRLWSNVVHVGGRQAVDVLLGMGLQPVLHELVGLTVANTVPGGFGEAWYLHTWPMLMRKDFACQVLLPSDRVLLAQHIVWWYVTPVEPRALLQPDNDMSTGTLQQRALRHRYALDVLRWLVPDIVRASGDGEDQCQTVMQQVLEQLATYLASMSHLVPTCELQALCQLFAMLLRTGLQMRVRVPTSTVTAVCDAVVGAVPWLQDKPSAVMQAVCALASCCVVAGADGVTWSCSVKTVVERHGSNQHIQRAWSRVGKRPAKM